MTAFAASAPAKIILCGEHAVVYGQPAIAVPVSSLRVTAQVSPNPAGRAGLYLIASEVMEQVILSANPPYPEDPLALAATLALQHWQLDAPDLTITVKSTIPIASGLGSGAAVTTAVIRALSMALDRPIETTTLNELVYEIEKLHHGTPSGIDNTVIVYEQPVLFVRDHPIERLVIGAPLHVLIGDTGQTALTRVAVGDVRRLYESSSSLIQPILDSIGNLVRESRKAIEHGDAPALGKLMNQNHSYLQQLTVSSPELDFLVTAARNAGALGAKLSGGGRGGNMIALVTPETALSVQSALLKAGAVRVFTTTLKSDPAIT
ncbi:MAG: mevalonate kinase [Anaerolineaceae bacterium]|nr:mevalonate kinase [Anaerolineaceae bacterium]